MNKPTDRHPRTTPPKDSNYINAQMWFSKEANTGGPEHTRITQHLRATEAIFLSCNRSFVIRNVWAKGREGGDDSYGSSPTRLTAEDIDLDLSEDVRKVYNEYKGSFKEINVLVCFVEGKYFAKNGRLSEDIARTYPMSNDKNFLVLLSELTEPSVLAHEIGHVLNISNKNGRADDPDPFPNDPSHNANIDNLMYPSQSRLGGEIITPAQCDQFFNSNIIL